MPGTGCGGTSTGFRTPGGGNRGGEGRGRPECGARGGPPLQMRRSPPPPRRAARSGAAPSAVWPAAGRSRPERPQISGDHVNGRRRRGPDPDARRAAPPGPRAARIGNRGPRNPHIVGARLEIPHVPGAGGAHHDPGPPRAEPRLRPCRVRCANPLQGHDRGLPDQGGDLAAPPAQIRPRRGREPRLCARAAVRHAARPRPLKITALSRGSAADRAGGSRPAGRQGPVRLKIRARRGFLIGQRRAARDRARGWRFGPAPNCHRASVQWRSLAHRRARLQEIERISSRTAAPAQSIKGKPKGTNFEQNPSPRRCGRPCAKPAAQ